MSVLLSIQNNQISSNNSYVSERCADTIVKSSFRECFKENLNVVTLRRRVEKIRPDQFYCLSNIHFLSKLFSWFCNNLLLSPSCNVTGVKLLSK